MAIPMTCWLIRRLVGVGFEDLLGVEVFDFGLIAEHLEVGVFEEGGAGVVEALADALLDLGLGDVVLAGGLFGDELEDDVAGGLFGVLRVGKGMMSVAWPGLSLETAA